MLAEQHGPSSTDVVFIDTLRVAANIGPDCWGRKRAQPIELTVYLHLKNTYLYTAGNSDNVLDSIHYGHLTKAISTLIRSKSEKEKDDDSFDGVDGLIDAVAKEAFKLAGDAADGVKVVVNVPKMILLAGGFSVEATIPRDPEHSSRTKKVMVTDLSLPVIIGVNAPEREAKQRVVTTLIVYEDLKIPKSNHSPVDYQGVIQKISKEIEDSSYLTIEKFVMEIARSACLFSDVIYAVTVRAQKPSALSFAQSSGVEITRLRKDLL